MDIKHKTESKFTAQQAGVRLVSLQYQAETLAKDLKVVRKVIKEMEEVLLKAMENEGKSTLSFGGHNVKLESTRKLLVNKKKFGNKKKTISKK